METEMAETGSKMEGCLRRKLFVDFVESATGNPVNINLLKLREMAEIGQFPTAKKRERETKLALASSVGSVSVIILVLGFLMWRRQRHNQPIFFDFKDRQQKEISFGNLRRFEFRELQVATSNFSNKNILGKGGFGNVYKGILNDGSIVAVKRLKDGNAAGGEIQFQTEVKMISLAVHHNLLRYEGLDKLIKLRLKMQPKSLRFVATNVAAVADDGIIFGPLDLFVFFKYMGFSTGKSVDQVKEDVKRDFLPALILEGGIWPIVQISNFRYVPVRYQLLYVNMFCLLDSAILSWMEQQNDAA